MSSFTRARANHTRWLHWLLPLVITLVLVGGHQVVGAGSAISGGQVAGAPLEDWLARLHAPGEPLLSVALSRDAGLTPDFAHPRLSLTAPQGLILIDTGSGAVLLESGPGETVQFISRDGGVMVTAGGASGELPLREPGLPEPEPPPLPLTAPGLLVVARQVGEPITVLELSRPGSEPHARYRGALLVVPGDRPGSLWLVNRVGLEAYLRGVVPVEMPASFSLEALKAQAVVARTYALYQLSSGHSYANGLAGLCDGISCQAYYGAGVERTRSDRAVAETAGLVITYAGQLIPTYYSSTAGGHTESATLLWGNSTAGVAAAAATEIPYLRGVPDNPEWAPLNDEERFRRFLAERPASFDDGSPYYRWSYTWTRADLEAHLQRTLKQLPSRVASFTPWPRPASTDPPGPNQEPAPAAPAAPAVAPPTTAPTTPPTTTSIAPLAPTAYLQDIVPVRRGVSGRLLALQIVTAEGIWTIQGELYVRRLFPVPRLGQLPSAAAIIDFVRDASGVIQQVTLTGTGAGHGVGLSQYGADGMARRGYQFTDIIAHYFPGTETRPWFDPSAAGSPEPARNGSSESETGTTKEEGAP